MKLKNSNDVLMREVTGGRKSCSEYIFLKKTLKDFSTVFVLDVPTKSGVCVSILQTTNLRHSSWFSASESRRDYSWYFLLWLYICNTWSTFSVPSLILVYKAHFLIIVSGGLLSQCPSTRRSFGRNISDRCFLWVTLRTYLLFTLAILLMLSRIL